MAFRILARVQLTLQDFNMSCDEVKEFFTVFLLLIETVYEKKRINCLDTGFFYLFTNLFKSMFNLKRKVAFSFFPQRLPLEF